MTGYGKHQLDSNGSHIVVEMRSVNNRYLDIITKIPRAWSHLEVDMKKILQTHFERGRIEITISSTPNAFSQRKLQLDWQLLNQFVENMQQVKQTYNLDGDISLDTLMTMEEIFLIEEADEDIGLADEEILQLVNTACDHLKTHRTSEGQYLIKDMQARMQTIHALLEQIEANQQIIQAHYRERMLERITSFMESHVEVDESTLVKELAILAEKGDITEEVTRLFSHLDHFTAIIQTDGAMGRKLDFITQEMHREANTIGAKSIDPALSNTIVTLKSEIEKIKEQIQNIE